jgi:peptide/nickel transport system ATP-binding protein
MSLESPLLDVKNLSTWIDSAAGTVRAVERVSFQVGAGETLALLGESGCGKSITALSLMRLLPDAGRVVAGSVALRGRELLQLPEAEMRAVRGGEMAMIFQEPATSLNPVLGVGKQIGEVLSRHAAVRGEALRRRSMELLEAVGIPDPRRRLDEYPFQLSGGMKQRVMIAMALAGDPHLLIADEPTTALDVTIQAQVLDLLAALQASRGMAMLLITHDLGVVARMAHRVGVMYAGELIETSSRGAFFAAPLHPYSRKLFAALPAASRRGGLLETIPGSVPPLTGLFPGCRFAERCAFAWDRCRLEAPAWSGQGEGRAVRCHLYEASATRRSFEVAPAAAGSCTVSPVREGGLLEVNGLSVHFPVRKGLLKRTIGHVRAVDGIDLRVAAGSTLALVGESGCGKTTAGKAILRLLRPTAGKILFEGTDLAALSRSAMRALRRSIQMIFQDPYASLNPRMRIGEILLEGMSALGVETDPAGRQRRVAEMLERVGLDAAMAGRYPHEFSGGQRQRIAIARALAVDPRLLICDEPTSALDVSVQAQILNLLGNLQRSMGLAYLFITHNIAVVDFLAREVAVMYLGRIVENGPADAILRAPAHPYTRALLSAVPRIDGERQSGGMLGTGDLPSAFDPPPGCHFQPRCPQATEKCKREYPGTSMIGAGHAVRCHLYDVRSKGTG